MEYTVFAFFILVFDIYVFISAHNDFFIDADKVHDISK